MREWYVLTFVMGSFFVAGQVYEYAALVSEGLTIASPVRLGRSTWPPASTACTSPAA